MKWNKRRKEPLVTFSNILFARMSKRRSRNVGKSDKEEVKAYEELVRGVYSKIFSLLTTARAMRKLVEDIRRRLEEPEFRNNILPVTHRILQENTHARKMLKRASEELDKAVEELRNALFAKTLEEPQTSFKTR